ncbi:MAG: hypothetical protein LIP12_17515 [Clostridiales bacterium]|nr:hypothetical protein [Clostridiales bacterium]
MIIWLMLTLSPLSSRVLAMENIDATVLITTASISSSEASSAAAVTTAETEKSTTLNGWVKDSSGNKYYYVKGKKVTGKKKIDGAVYYFDPSDGVMLKNGWVKFSTGKSYFGSNGKRVTGLKKIGSKTYYFKSNGIMVTSTWKTFEKGKSYFSASGARVTGKKKINGKYYYFNASGIMKTGLKTIDSKTYYFKPSTGVMVTSKWVTFSKGKSYFNAKGVRATGLTKIDGKYYYFSTGGILKTGTTTVGKNTYYADSKGVLSNWKIGSTYYNSKGKEMDSVAVKEFETYLRAVSIAEEITTSSMSKSQKLKVCFDWVMAKHYAQMTVGINYPGWTADHANDHFLYGRGNCFADACALAYLAKAIGYTEVYVCSDSTGKGAHGWCEIDGKVYDPLFAQAKSYSKYYGANYSSYYTQKPALHVKI